jgi:hypothetical protein
VRSTPFTTDDAAVLLTVWPERRRPLIRGVGLDAIQEAFPGWDVADLGPTGYHPPKALDVVLRPDERFYRLRRSSGGRREQGW